MRAGDFLSKVKKYAKANSMEFEWNKALGKGSHGTLYLGSRRTTVKDLKKELSHGAVHGMCKDLGIKLEDLQ